ncbi:THO complex subunit 5 homolog [Macrosteles quadrilineatus]|uniref:THO complex subunit 5 homolog n=1 Tax=Macrosteles quadrilineatus TaxID=74068 RepID=UPI0023E20429|nr:THO complex subunit 5 homolog [Macrosteles quadrilineatus]
MGKENSTAKDTADPTSPKKRKKDTTQTSTISKPQSTVVATTTSDIYKEVITNEEEEAIARDPSKDLELFCKTSEQLRTLANEINDLKNGSSSQASTQIAEKRIHASLLFVTLKKLNRLEKFRTNQNREKLHKAKQQADSCHLQLQNLLYEILHLEKEITKCLQFKSKDEEIELVPVEKFYEEAPKSISRPDVTKKDSHQLKLARLEWELKQRKQLAALCNDLQKEKEKVAVGINKKQSQLDNLAPMLKDLFNASKPVQEALGLQSGPSPAQQRVAEQLPPPLYFLFVQADALREAGDNFITVKIEGDEDEVQRMKQSLEEAVTFDDSDSDNQEDSGGKRHHGHRKKSKQDRLQEKRKMLLMAHPLSVVLTVSLKDGQGSISLEFSYLVRLHIVTVKPKLKLSSQVNISSTSSVLWSGKHQSRVLLPSQAAHCHSQAKAETVLTDGQGSISLEFSYLVRLHIVTVKPKLKLSSQVNISSTSSVLWSGKHQSRVLLPRQAAHCHSQAKAETVLTDGQGSISLEFSYLVRLHIVTVKPKLKLSSQVNISSTSSVNKLLHSEHILTELFPEDFGEGSPNTANYYQLKLAGIDSFDSSELGLAYIWAQRMCGLNFVSCKSGDDDIQAGKALLPSRQVSQLYLPNTISAIKRRLKARIALCQQIQLLEHGKLEEAEIRQMFPPKLVSGLTQWTPLSWAQYEALGFTSNMVEHHYVTERDILYKGTLVRGSARLTVAVAIKQCYPLLPPVFTLQASYENKTIQASNNDSIRDIEREVNAYFKELIDKTKSVHNLLTAQVLRLVTNFDLLLEASTNQDFPRDKIFIQSNRGRNRAWPFKQMELSSGAFHFTQR